MSQPATLVPHRGLITVSIMLATIMQVLDTTIANVALPTMTGDLGASPGQDQLGADLLHRGGGDHDAGDRLARRPHRPARAVADFDRRLHHHVDAVRHGLEPGKMVMFRLFQGVFGAAIVPLSQTFLLDINPKEKHGQPWRSGAPASWSARSSGLRSAAGSPRASNWRWVFFINLPVGILAFLGCGSLPSQDCAKAARLRLLRFRHALARRRCAAADAGSRRRSRLVLVDGNLDRAWPVHCRLLGVHRASGDWPGHIHRREDFRRPQFQHRPGLHLHRRRHPARLAWRCCRRCCRNCSTIPPR